MIKYALPAVAFLAFFSVHALAQNSHQSTQPPRVPTMFGPVGTSMAALLDDGWTIVSGGGPMIFVLRKANKWISCAVDEGSFSGNGPTSQCIALN